MMEFQVTSNRPQPIREAVFHFAVFGNFAGNEVSRQSLQTIEVNKSNFEDLFQRLSPTLEINLELPNISDEKVLIKIENLKDFKEKGLRKKIPLLAQIKSLSEQVQLTNADKPLDIDAWSRKQTHQSLKRLAAENPSSSGVVDLLSMVDLGDEDEGLELGLIHELFSKPSYDGHKRDRLLAQLNSLETNILKQCLSHESFNQLHGQWRGLYGLVSKLPSTVRLSLVDVAKDDICDAVYLIFVDPETEDPQPLDLAMFCHPLAHGEQDRHIVHHLGRMASSIHVPFILETAVQLLGYRGWHHLSHAREVSEKIAGPGHIKWRKLRDEPGAEWLFLAANPMIIQADSEGSEEARALMPAGFGIGLIIGQEISEPGKWPGELLQPKKTFKLGNDMAAKLTEDLAEDMAFNGLCPLGMTADGDQRLLGMTSIARITTHKGQSLAAAMVPFSLPYRFYSGCCSRAFQSVTDLDHFRQYAGLSQEASLVIEKDEEQTILRIQPEFTIFGIRPDLVMGR